MIVNAFIDDVLDIGNTKDAQDALKELCHMTKLKCAGKPSHIQCGIDPSYVVERYTQDERLDPRYRALTLSPMLQS
jgi:hypothetical protein